MLSILLALGWIASVTATLIASHGHVWTEIGSGCAKLHIFRRPIYSQLSVENVKPIYWLPSVYANNPRYLLTSFGIHVPFWCIAIPNIILTAILWRRDRAFPLGHCRCCGYDLTGNVSGACPECGEDAESPVTDLAK